MESGHSEKFFGLVDGKSAVLLEVKAFKNRNLHVRLNQSFALALNVEYGRLKGWLKSGQHAAEELQDTKAPAWYGANVQLATKNLLSSGLTISDSENKDTTGPRMVTRRKGHMMTMELAKEIAGYALAAIGIAAFAMMAFCNFGMKGKDGENDPRLTHPAE